MSRDGIMDSLTKTDIVLFGHETGESPRCLGEGLATGCAFVGYESAYPLDLVARHGGREFSEKDNWSMLSEIIILLDGDRKRLSQLVEAAAASGRTLDRDAAIRFKVDLIRKYLAV